VHIPASRASTFLKELHGEDYPAPIFMISGQGDIAMAVNAIKSGALDFIEKAVPRQRDRRQIGRGDRAYAVGKPRTPHHGSQTMHFPGREPLTRREREVLEQFTAGASNKEAGRHLGSARERSRITAPIS